MTQIYAKEPHSLPIRLLFLKSLWFSYPVADKDLYTYRILISQWILGGKVRSFQGYTSKIGTKAVR